MKKFFYLVIALAMCASNANAIDFDYEPESGFSFMGLFGMNISNLQNHEYGTKVGALMGARAEFMLPNAHGTYLTAGFDWTMKGGKGHFVLPLDDKTIDATGKYPLHYFEIPLRVGFRYNLMEELGFYAEVGPYFAIGIGGNHKVSSGEDGSIFRQFEDIQSYKVFKNYGYPTESFQRWDSGIGFRIGTEYNQHYNLMFGCDWGLADIYRVSLRDAYFDQNNEHLPKVHNFNFSITFGYRF